MEYLIISCTNSPACVISVGRKAFAKPWKRQGQQRLLLLLLLDPHILRCTYTGGAFHFTTSTTTITTTAPATTMDNNICGFCYYQIGIYWDVYIAHRGSKTLIDELCVLGLLKNRNIQISSSKGKDLVSFKNSYQEVSKMVIFPF